MLKCKCCGDSSQTYCHRLPGLNGPRLPHDPQGTATLALSPVCRGSLVKAKPIPVSAVRSQVRISFRVGRWVVPRGSKKNSWSVVILLSRSGCYLSEFSSCKFIDLLYICDRCIFLFVYKIQYKIRREKGREGREDEGRKEEIEESLILRLDWGAWPWFNSQLPATPGGLVGIWHDNSLIKGKIDLAAESRLDRKRRENKGRVTVT